MQTTAVNTTDSRLRCRVGKKSRLARREAICASGKFPHTQLEADKRYFGMQGRIGDLLVLKGEARILSVFSEGLGWLRLEPSNISFGATVGLTIRRFMKARPMLRLGWFGRPFRAKLSLDRLGKGELASERTAFGAWWKWRILHGTVISLDQVPGGCE